MSSHSTTLIEAALAGKPIHRFAPEHPPVGLEGEWHSLVPVLTDRESLLGAFRKASDDRTGQPLSDWARRRFFPAGDPFNAIAEAIMRLYASRSPHARRSVPDHRRLWCGRIAIEHARKRMQRSPVLLGRTKVRNATMLGRTADIFGADDVAKRLLRWRRVL
jgi:hypothetical protein